MGKIADAFERQQKEYEENKIFILKLVEIDGELRETLTTDDSIVNVLSFRGTGDTKLFSEIQKEFIKYSDWWLDTLIETGQRPIKDNPWLDSWVMQKNYRVIYEVGDITFNKTSKRGVFS